MQIRKIKILLFFLVISIVGQSQINELKKYLIPTPKKITLKNENSEIIVNKFNSFFTKIKHTNFIGKIPTIRFLYSISEFETRIDSSLTRNDEYILEISNRKISITGKSSAAVFYGKQTLLQIIEYSSNTNLMLPCLKIHDYADFPRRGFMLDISRDKVPKIETLFMIIDRLASWKINEFQLYTEHTFAYKNHSIVWQEYSPMTPEEIKQLDKYCKERFIDLVPNQNSFGHMERWLDHDEYLDLAECPDYCNTVWGPMKRSSLNPVNPKSFELMQELYAELLPNFTSKYFNIGCDETVELGLGKSADVCQQKGKGRVYLEFLIKLNSEVNNHRKYAQFWGDIIVNHPELVPELPKNMIALVWGYNSSFSAGKNLSLFQNAGLKYYVCPGTSSWNSLIGRNSDAFENLKNAAIKGKEYGAVGFLNTAWGDHGHWQPLSVDYPAMMVGAAYAWNLDEEILNNLEFQLNYYIFKDNSGNTAKALLKLGDAYKKTNIPEGNANAFHLMLRRYKWTMEGFYQTKNLNIEGLLAAENEIKEALEILKNAKPQCEDANIVVQELKHAANLALHGIKLGIERLKTPDKQTLSIPKEIRNQLFSELDNLIQEHKRVWVYRNREGGLKQSASKLEEVLEYYKQ